MKQREPQPGELEALANRPDYYHYIVLANRIGALSFTVFLEHENFDPCDEALNAKHFLTQMEWPEERPETWFVSSIPHRYRPAAEALMKRLGLRAINYPPCATVSDRAVIISCARPERRFPGSIVMPIWNTEKCYTLEHQVAGGHFAYQNDPATHQAALEAEKAAIEKKCAGSMARWKAMREGRR